MSTAPMSKADRRQIISEYKERETPRGIYAIRCAVSHEVWVGSSPNLTAAQNSIWFQLRNGLHRSKDLQAAWTRHGEPPFAFEIVEQLSEDVAELNLRDVLLEKKAEWASELSAKSL